MRLIVGISGASGVEMGYRLLLALKAQPDCELHLVLSEGARETWLLECSEPLERLFEAADYHYSDHELAARIASGSFETDGMIVLPCSMKSLSAIAHGYAAGLLVRAVDVCLKEGRPVILCPREMPLGKVHLKNMLEAADLGCAILPPMLTFYNQARSLEQQIDHLIGKILMRFGLKHAPFRAWNGGENERLA